MVDAKREDIRLAVDGVLYGGWQGVSVVHGIDTGAVTFSLDVTDKWEGQPTKRVIRPGAVCALSASGDGVMSGHVDDVTIAYDVDTHSITIVGRDPVGDLVDCAAVVDGPFEFAGLTIPEFAGKIARPYGVKVSADVNVGAPFGRFAVQPGETAWAAIERACRLRALLPVSDGKGGLVLTRAGQAGRANGSLDLGRNIKSGSGTFSYRDRFSQVTVLGQQEGNDNLDPNSIAGPRGRATDSTVTRHRPTVVMAEQAGDTVSLTDRANWEVRVARGRSRTTTYTAQGWRDDGGALWRPNTIVRVRDDYQDIDFDMLIVSVSFAISSAGTTADLALSLKDAYDLLPDPEQPANGASGYWDIPQ